MNKDKLAVAIIVKNGQKTIKKSLESAFWADEIVILDDHSTDTTIEIAKKFTTNIYTTNQPNFAAKRNELLTKIQSEWILYLDSDEIITKDLVTEIQEIVANNYIGAYRISRQNFFLGTKMYSDAVDRLFHKNVLIEWSGEVHESPIIKGKIQPLKHFIIHHTHTDITSMLEKTNQWSEMEADLRIKAKHPPMAWWRLIRIAVTQFWQQFFIKNVGKFGREGIFEGYFQIIDKLIVYTKLWEKQKKQ